MERVLKESTQVLDDEAILYLAIGSIATTALGYDESCSDIDLLVAPDDAERALKALDKRGFHIHRSEPDWLYKAVKERVLVDLIFKVGDQNEVCADEDMFRRGRATVIHEQVVRVVSPEDFLIMQAISVKRDAPDYWFKGLQAVSQAGLDWDYIVTRAGATRLRVLSLLVYARAEGIDVPKEVLDELYSTLA